MTTTNRHRKVKGFTLIELLVVIAIIGILAAILIPVVGRVRESAKSAQCISNVRQIALAANLYADANRDQLPFGYTAGSGQWHLVIEPYFGNPREGWSARSTALLTCPSAERPPDASRSSYAANPRVMLDGQQSGATQVRRARIPRPSEVVLIGDGGTPEGFNASWGYTAQADIYANNAANMDVPLPDNSSNTGNAVIRWRHGQAQMASFGFVDGHAKAMRVGEAKQRHFQISY